MQHPEPEELAVAALPAEPVDESLRAHLEECSSCRSELAALRRTVGLARTGAAEDVETPPARVWDAIRDELAADDDHDAVPREQVDTRSHRRWWRAVAVPAAAAVIGVCAGLGIAALSSETVGGAERSPLSSISATAPRASGSVEVTSDGPGREISIRVDDVGTAAGSGYLEAWLIDATGSKLVSLGPLVPDGSAFTGSFRLPAGLPVTEFGLVDVSAEQWDGDPSHSQVSLVRGALS